MKRGERVRTAVYLAAFASLLSIGGGLFTIQPAYAFIGVGLLVWIFVAHGPWENGGGSGGKR